MLGRRNKNKFTFSGITPDEIFMDSENIPGFDSRQLEGRIESALKPKIFFSLGALFFLLSAFLLLRTGQLQIIKGAYFLERSQNNHLRAVSLAAERGLIYDRNGELLAWNAPAFYLTLKSEELPPVYEQTQSRLAELFNILKLKEEDIKKLKRPESENNDLVLSTFYDWEEINNIHLQWNDLPLGIKPTSLRTYKNSAGLGHVIGYVGYPSLDDLTESSGVIYENLVGKDGIEKKFESALRGAMGLKLVELDSVNQIKSEFVQKNSVPGKNIKLTIDFRIQNKLYDIISSVSSERGFQGGAAVIVDVTNGEIMSLVSFPEYDSRILSAGELIEEIESYRTDSRKPFLNRATSGLYTPGSIIKPYIALAALNEKIISPQKQIFSSGSISIPNPYREGADSVFLDWKAHGWVDMEKALAVSSNVYFYTIGGGYDDVRGLGIENIKKYLGLFGFGKATELSLGNEPQGVIPGPEIKLNNPTDSIWRIGDTYNASIGQGNFQVTPLQVALAVSAVANNGRLIKPRVVLEDEDNKNFAQEKFEKADVPEEYFNIVKQGMRKAVLEGTARGLSDLPVEIAAKTGTAELGSAKNFVNSWFTAFWPFKNPRYAISIVLEKGSATNLIGSVFVARQLFEWMIVHTPEYLSY